MSDSINPIFECAICAESEFETKPTTVICPYCEFETCEDCVKTFLVLQDVDRCMRCQHPWEEHFVRTHLSDSWIRHQYTAHLKVKLLNREKSYLPESQRFVPLYQALSEAEQAVVNFQAKHRSTLKKIHHQLQKEEDEYEFFEDDLWSVHVEHKELLHHHDQLLQTWKEALDQADTEDWTVQDASEIEPSSNVIHFRHCIESKCRGYLDASGCCGMCNVKVCMECNQLMNPTHVCKNEDVLDVKEILSSTKPCPKCRTRITKTEGCNHMFCVNCATGFDWVSGKRIDDRINTNPMMIQWRNERRLEPQTSSHQNFKDEDCIHSNRVDNYIVLIVQAIKRHLYQRCGEPLSILSSKICLRPHLIACCISAQSFIHLLSRDATHRFTPDPTPIHTVHRLERVMYLCDELDEAKLGTLVMQTHKRRLYQEQASQLFYTFVTLFAEWLNHILFITSKGYFFYSSISSEGEKRAKRQRLNPEDKNNNQTVIRVDQLYFGSLTEAHFIQMFEDLIKWMNTQCYELSVQYGYKKFYAFERATKMNKFPQRLKVPVNSYLFHEVSSSSITKLKDMAYYKEILNEQKEPREFKDVTTHSVFSYYDLVADDALQAKKPKWVEF